jgi:IclR family transcriptional regulator, acetate operon repressor
MEATQSKSGEGTAAIDKALDVIDAIAQAPDGLSQAQLSSQLGVPRTTLYRLLATLVARGVVRRDPQQRVFRAGLRWLELAQRSHTAPDLVAIAGAELRALRDLTGETAYLAVQDGLEVLSLARTDGAHSHRSNAAIGQRKPMHCTSQGKAILSILPDDERDAIIRKMSLKPLTEKSITDKRRLLADLRVCAHRGYAIDDEEIVMGVRCVGAPIVDSSGKVRGALSVAAPTYRVSMQRAEALGAELTAAARRIGEQLLPMQPVDSLREASAVPGPWAFVGNYAHWHAPEQVLYWCDALAPSIRRYGKGSIGNGLIDAGTVSDEQHSVLTSGYVDEQWLTLTNPVTGMLLDHDSLLVAHPQGFQRIELKVKPKSAAKESEIVPWIGSPITAWCRSPEGTIWAVRSSPNGGSEVLHWQPNQEVQVSWKINEPILAITCNSVDRSVLCIAGNSASVLKLTPGNTAMRRLASVPIGSGKPVGLGVDADGGIWLALQDGWSIIRLSQDGQLDRVVALPVPSPTGLVWAGAHRTLYVTSARHSVSMDMLTNAPDCGRLFSVHLP